LRAVRRLAAFYRPTPNQFNEEQLREYFFASRITIRTQNPFNVRKDRPGWPEFAAESRFKESFQKDR